MILNLSNCRIERLPNGNIEIVGTQRTAYQTGLTGPNGAGKSPPEETSRTVIESREFAKLRDFLSPTNQSPCP